MSAGKCKMIGRADLEELADLRVRHICPAPHATGSAPTVHAATACHRKRGPLAPASMTPQPARANRSAKKNVLVPAKNTTLLS